MHTPPRTNSYAVICIILGAISFVVPLVGIATGIIGIIYYRKARVDITGKGETGEGLAITGLIFCIIGLALQVLIILFIILMFGFIAVDAMPNSYNY